MTPTPTPPPAARPTPAIHSRRSLGRRVVLSLSVALAVLSAGCQRLADYGGDDPPVSLQVAISTGQESDQVSRSNLKALATQIANEYMRNHPHVLLNLRMLPETDLVESVRARAKLGAGPDLLISRVSPVEILDREGFLKPVDISASKLDPLRIQYLSEFRDGAFYEALPFLLQPHVACYDRRKLPKPPAKLNDLTASANAGVRVGFPLQMFNLLWTASDFQADQPLLRLFRTRVPPKTLWEGLSPGERSRVEGWLGWLYKANMIPNVLFVDTADDLVERMERGQLDWISCQSTAIARLQRALGPHLGVSVLPAANNGQPARPLARLQLISFGRDSTAAQRRVATNFALFVLNDFSQSNLMGKAFGSMPVNQNVVVPVKDSPALAAMETSLKHSTVPTFQTAIGFRRGIGLLSGSVDPMTQLLKQAAYAEETPQDVASGIEQLSKAIFENELANQHGHAAMSTTKEDQ
ncbi:MAG: extracellular solute-binding protein [Cyanobacteriota bacterium]|nr:extracellular solute-binding protein [Cyanobacteriota bacterium]